MTVIAVKDGAMAADSLSAKSGLKSQLPRDDTKIARCPIDGSLVGGCGSAVDCYLLRQWVLSGMDFDNRPKFSYPDPDNDHAVDWLWLKADGTAWRGDAALNVHPTAGITTIGCSPAWCYAESAMRLGFSAEEAVEHAIKHCGNVGGPVQVERLEPATSHPQTYDCSCRPSQLCGSLYCPRYCQSLMVQ